MDSHIHSEYSPDSKSKLKDIFKVAKSRNIDIIAISDHNTVDGSKEARRLTKKDDLLVIPSIEISSIEGHILGFGCEEKIDRDLPAAETIDLIHDQSALAIIPHPYCFYRHGLLCKADYKDLKIDAIETKNARFIVGYCNNKAKNLSKNENLPSLGASDAHYFKFVGDCYSKIDCEKDIDSVLKSIKKGKVEAFGKGTSNIKLSKYLFEYKVLKKFD
ncbi:PHP domain-containing protein [Methanobrevibacter millerae]|uniref:PHP domain-containing protein n=2 Tax=Methanobrevibacter millerae TaxID=230361 RepID=A0A0U3E1F0_9EURY|nr:PHP domain-containing protein [Methanobrevibacter millerae]